MSSMVKRISFFYLIFQTCFAHAAVVNVNINDFYADQTIIISPDGTSAFLTEDQNLSTVLLSNDPFFGDPGILIPSGLLSLSFNYSFTEAANNDDEFYALLFDGVTGNLIHDFIIDLSSAGTVTWDLSGIDPIITLLGLEFQLNALPLDIGFESTLDINDIHLTTLETNTVPEPSNISLFAIGIIGLFLAKRKCVDV